MVMENEASNAETLESSEMKQKRLELLFGDPNLKIEDIVRPIGEKELMEQLEKLKKEKEDLLRKDEESVTIQSFL